MTVQHNAIAELFFELMSETIAQRPDTLHRGEVTRKFACLPQRRGQQRALGAGAPAALMASAMNQGLQSAGQEPCCRPNNDRQRIGNAICLALFEVAFGPAHLVGDMCETDNRATTSA